MNLVSAERRMKFRRDPVLRAQLRVREKEFEQARSRLVAMEQQQAKQRAHEISEMQRRSRRIIEEILLDEISELERELTKTNNPLKLLINYYKLRRARKDLSKLAESSSKPSLFYFSRN